MASLSRFYPSEYEVLRRLSSDGMPEMGGHIQHLVAYGLTSESGELRLGSLRRFLATQELSNSGPSRFTRIARLGSGATGTVWRCADTLNGGRTCAIKVYTGEQAEQAAQLEWIALQAVASEYVPKAIEKVEVDGQPAVVMEFVEGHTLTDIIRTGGLTFERLFEVTSSLLLGIESIHPSERRRRNLRDEFAQRSSVSDDDFQMFLGALEIGHLHRDIKPDNIVVQGGPSDQEWVARYVDLQLAKPVDDALLTKVGTPAYAPPDWGTNRWDTSFDLYSLGVVFFELIFGERPAPNESERTRQLRNVARDAADVLGVFFARALAPAAGERFSDAREMAGAWEETVTHPCFPKGPFPLDVAIPS